MNEKILAVDMGNNNTRLYLLGEDIVTNDSVVAISDSPKKTIKAVGEDAKNLIGKTSENTSIVFPVFEGNIENTHLAIAMLKNFLTKLSNKKIPTSTKTIVSVPCGSDEKLLKQYTKVFNNVGFYNLDYIESPVASALGLGLAMNASSPYFIIDIGGGVTNISAVSLDGVIAGISVNMGGSNIDAMLIDHIEDLFGLKIGMLTAEKLKIKTASLIENDSQRMLLNGRDIETGRPRSVNVGSNDIKLPIKLFYDKIIEIASMVLAKLPAEVSAEIRKEGIYFAGGGALIPGIEDFVMDVLGIPSKVESMATSAVILGLKMIADDKNLLRNLRLKPKN